MNRIRFFHLAFCYAIVVNVMIVQLYCIRTVSGAKSVHSTSKPWYDGSRLLHACFQLNQTLFNYTYTFDDTHAHIEGQWQQQKHPQHTTCAHSNPYRFFFFYFCFSFSLSMFFGGIVNVGNVCIWIECCLYAKFHNSDSISVKTCNNFQAQFSTNRRTMRTFSRSNSRIFALVWLSLALYHCWSDSMYLNF